MNCITPDSATHTATITLERARIGDQTAIKALIRSLEPRIEKMAHYYARCTGEDPDDLLQEAWLGLLESLPHLDITIGAPEQFLICRAKWKLLNLVRHNRRRRSLSLEEEMSPPPFDSGSSCDPALAATFAAEFERGLSPMQRNVLRCLLAGQTWREAGRELGCSSANVAYHVRQIQRRYEAWNR